MNSVSTTKIYLGIISIKHTFACSCASQTLYGRVVEALQLLHHRSHVRLSVRIGVQQKAAKIFPLFYECQGHVEIADGVGKAGGKFHDQGDAKWIVIRTSL
jgi:hypothetical protein